MNPICFPIAIIAVGALVLAMAVFTAAFGLSDEFYKG